jgi:3-phenylpropionate/cinnamic acid dioxygenase small subunit
MEFSDYLQITNILHRYAHLMDQADFEGVGQLFAHADVYMPGDAGTFRKDPGGLTELFRRWTRVYPDTGTLRTRHITTNLILEDDGPGRAKARCYVLVVQATPNFPLQPVIAGTYEDRFERVDGVWRFAERREEFKNFELVGDLSAHLALDYKPTGSASSQ